MVDIAKAGWLFRQTSFLKRWKKSWFSLSMDGHLRQFESPNDFIAKKTIHISREVIAIKVGADVNSKAPNGLSMDFLIKLITREDSWILCAENIDDKLAWQITLEQARIMGQQNRQAQEIPAYFQEAITQTPAGRYPVYHRGRYGGNYPSRIVHTPQGPVTVVYVDQPNYNRYRGGNLAFGALAGTALASSLLFTPLWFPLWC